LGPFQKTLRLSSVPSLLRACVDVKQLYEEILERKMLVSSRAT